MRDTDPPADPWRPLGSPIPKPAPPTPSKPQETPRGDYGVMQGPDGKFRTTKHPNK